jgi:hypothetical protein
VADSDIEGAGLPCPYPPQGDGIPSVGLNN